VLRPSRRVSVSECLRAAAMKPSQNPGLNVNLTVTQHGSRAGIAEARWTAVATGAAIALRA